MWELKGSYDSSGYENGKFYVKFLVDNLGEKPILGDTELSIKIDKWRPPKSLNANGYYWALCTKLSNELSKQTFTSVARIHNMHLRSIWQDLVIYEDGSPVMDVYPDTDAAEQQILEYERKHLVPVPDRLVKPFTNSSGKRFRYYFELKGSSEMDSKEFSRLVDMVVQECRDQGIRTKDDEDLERLEGYAKNR